jgi:RHS repeat-associated protein
MDPALKTFAYNAANEMTLAAGVTYTYDRDGRTETGNDYFGARYYASNFGRFLSPDWSAIPAPVPYANLTNPQTLNLYAIVRDNPETFADLDGHADGDHPCTMPNACNQTAPPSHTPAPGEGPSPTPQKSGDGQSVPPPAQKINKDKIVDTMDKNAHGTNTYNGYCASACRKGLRAGGVKVPLVNGHRYPNANEYGPVLLKNGASIVPEKGYVPEKGDVVVFEGGGPHNHPNGHIAIYDGKQWISDTRQTQMAPNRSGYPGGYTIYRFPN